MEIPLQPHLLRLAGSVSRRTRHLLLLWRPCRGQGARKHCPGCGRPALTTGLRSALIQSGKGIHLFQHRTSIPITVRRVSHRRRVLSSGSAGERAADSASFSSSAAFALRHIDSTRSRSGCSAHTLSALSQARRKRTSLGARSYFSGPPLWRGGTHSLRLLCHCSFHTRGLHSRDILPSRLSR